MRWTSYRTVIKVGVATAGVYYSCLLFQQQMTAAYAKEKHILDVNNYKPRHPSDFIHGLLSSHAYLDSRIEEDQDNPVIFPLDNIKVKYNDYLSAWQIQEVHDQYKESHASY